MDGGEPEVLDDADDFEEAFEIDGFGDIAVAGEVVDGGDVFVGLRCGQDDDGNTAIGGVGFDLFEDLAA